MTDANPLSPADLRRYGEALYGERWQTPLARALGVGDRTLRYWVVDRFAIPDGTEDKLKVLARKRIRELERLAA